MRRSRAVPLKGKPKFAFVVDGECEFWYFQMLKRNERAISVDLKPEIPQKKKLSDQFDKTVELSKYYDKVFWIVDFDVINSETRLAPKGTKTAIVEFKNYCDAINKKHKNIIVIINNPCLEYWFLLHYEASSKYFESCEDVTKQLKKHLPEYSKTKFFYTKQDNDIYLKLKPRLINAIINAGNLDQFNFQNPHTGMSQMPLFFETEQIKSIVQTKA
jgi:hypothetical protein